MTDAPQDLTLVLLRRLDEKMDGLAADMIEVKTRLGHLEGLYANLSGRVDRMAGDILQIKRRLDLVDA
jgi:hypothetical protein